MLELLNTAVKVFGAYLGDLSSKATIICLIAIQALIALVAIILIIYLLKDARHKQATENVVYTVAPQPAPEPQVIYVKEPTVENERTIVGISLDLEVVQRKFNVGDEFNCDGLVVHAEYNTEPTSEMCADYSIVDSDTFLTLDRENKRCGVYVIYPDMSAVGKKIVSVVYANQADVYSIDVCEVEAPQPEPQVVYVQEPSEVVERMLVGISLDTRVVKREFKLDEEFDCVGLIVLAKYNVEPSSESFVDFTVVNSEEYATLESKNLLQGVYVLRPDMVETGKKLVTVRYGDQSDVYTIEVVEVAEEQPAVVVTQRDPLIVEEDSFDARLRYDKSFTARLIQSEDETKYWYTDLKNILLSYKAVHGRISWKRETFKCHKDVVAKLAYRGKTLCIFLPLNPADYIENHPVEDASDTTSYEETPLMLRLKNQRRVKFAKQLLETVMEQKGIKQVPHETVDYYMPYEGILELINKGLIKREVKTAEDEAIFEKDKGAERQQKEEDDTFALEEVVPGVYVTKK